MRDLSTDERRAVVRELSEAGWSQVAMARELGVTRRTIQKDLEHVEQRQGATPLTREGDRFVRLLLDQGTSRVSRSRTTGSTPLPALPWDPSDPRWWDYLADPSEVTDCRGQGWIYGWHPSEGFIYWYKKAKNTTTVLKCCKEHNAPRRTKQTTRGELCLPTRPVRYVFEHFTPDYESAQKNARRHQIPMLTRSTDTPRGRLWFVIAADQITSRRTADRGNITVSGKDETLHVLNRSLEYENLHDLVRIQTTEAFRLEEDTEEEGDDEEPKGYTMRNAPKKVNPAVVAREVLGRDVGYREQLTPAEWFKVWSEVERRRKGGS